jgi:RNA 2',3'-cyclic 3'-phosphodiesterase
MALADHLELYPLPGKPVPPENWHMTLRFLGSTESLAYEKLLAGLDQTDLGPPFTAVLGPMGAFSRPRTASVLWMAIEQGREELERLAAVVEEVVEAAGFEGEERPFRAHLTLSRLRPVEDVGGLLDKYEETNLRWRVEAIAVFRSHLGGGPARYEVLETFPLKR